MRDALDARGTCFQAELPSRARSLPLFHLSCQLTRSSKGHPSQYLLFQI